MSSFLLSLVVCLTFVLPFCKANCNNLVIANSATISYSDNLSSNHAVNTTAEFTCANGFTVTGGPSTAITCTGTTWSSAGICDVARFVNLEFLRLLSRKGAASQKWSIDWDEYGLSKAQMTIMMSTLVALFGLGLGIGSFYLQRQWVYKPLHKNDDGPPAATLIMH